MVEILLLTDYHEQFGSKYNSIPYRSGLDKLKLSSFFNGFGIQIRFIGYSEVDVKSKKLQNQIFVHDSIEDTGYLYKSYIEDVVLALELSKAMVIPGYKFIRAHNNKVFMEFLRDIVQPSEMISLVSKHFGTKEEFLHARSMILYPIVIKGAEDAQGRQVFLGHNEKSSILNINKLTQKKEIIYRIKETLRAIIHKGYMKESFFRKKFIIQNFICGLSNDWKILIFYDIIYILNRGIRKGDFRASGSKLNYKFGSQANPPDGIFDYAYSVFKKFLVPYISLDVVHDGTHFYVIEFQFVSFGSSTHLNSDCYFKRTNYKWKSHYEILELEYLYAYSISNYIKDMQ